MSDEWEENEAFHYRMMPETVISDFFTDERDMLTITREHGKWWLSETNVMGSGEYDTLADAKAAGNEQITQMQNALPDALLAEAGLDPARWTVEIGDLLVFKRDDGATIQADTERRRQRWSVYGQGDEPLVTNMPSVKAAAVTMPD